MGDSFLFLKPIHRMAKAENCNLAAFVDQSVDRQAKRGQPIMANPLKLRGRDDWI